MSITNAAPDSAPSQEAKPASGGATTEAFVADTLRKRRGLAIAIARRIAIVVLAIVLWWLHARNYEFDRRRLYRHPHRQISPQVAAAIVDVPVTDNQLVEAGTELVRLDDRDYIAQRDQAKASVDNLIAQIAAQQAKIDQADKQVAQAQAALTFAQQEADRYERLAEAGRRHRRAGAAIFLEPPASQGVIRGRAGQCRRHREAGSGAQRRSCEIRQERSWRRPRPICRAPSSPRRSPAA